MNMADLSRIDLNLLAVLDVIYTEGGVTRASEKLNLTQPAISHALGRLRQAFGDPLFVRQGRSLTPTPLTRQLIGPLRRSLRAVGDTLQAARRFDPATSEARFTIALRDPAEMLVLPQLMRAVATAAPRIDLTIVQVRRRNVEAALAAGTLDFAIDVPLLLSESVRRQRIAADRLVVVARKRHPAVRAGLSLATYLRQEHVMVTSRRQGPGLEDLALSQSGARRRIRLRCRNYAAACRVVAGTDLVLTMAERYAGVLNAAYGNRIVPFPLRTPTLDACLYWHETADSDPANRWLRTLLLQAFRT
ncbi:MAG TPA: LysR family transcriptional regulator [Candidatus Sulfotelmatobacter sp.]|nr:LysR family transcriptional regulator [Candidatus Sulfotelmatobacter sp.]